ncbi:SDR family oxidoreductase [Ochrobactrum quorumnocens]|jgi:nucleoside-diphosphate-sugar epimerase|uniref:SDR family oxidoreductase n=1 Tax=Ochrobactrum quorumnocens TaxID=271865 RepID=A0A5N1JTP6_9HYPH|nr:SDR family oxidoreductase [[Ochrobactrum] quorumnocens]KAA9366608.1 SDR family oxidoreductase [[Ochrobactrum] quorumnocens]MBD7992496.1 SDR family oxidoreductase [Ochrobactrum gallinarum]
MRIFLTGATGFIGSHIIPELIWEGHEVLGLTRSDAGAEKLVAAGAEAHRGDIEDLESLRRGAAQCDAVIHTAFDHNFANFQANCAKDHRVIEALGSALEGTERPLVITSATAMGAAVPGEPAVESHFNPHHPNPRVASELAGYEQLQRGVNVSVMRLSQIHDTRKQGLVSELIPLAVGSGVSAYIGEGANQWSAAHIDDTAHLYRLAVERAEPGARYHATAEQGIAFRAIAEAVGAALNLPVASLNGQEAAEHFGWLTAFVSKDMSASNTLTRERLGWNSLGPGLLEDLAQLER